MGEANTQLLRLATAGSVDDGKSTLVGRLLHDTRTVLADQLAAVERASRDRGLDALDLSLLTDGLRAEREQGITIDVAYRYFATARRAFVLADTPGHVQYTRNTVTGMSTAEAAVVLVDARRGVAEQTRRHLTVAALLRVPHVVLAVNKMDAVGYAQEAFTTVAAETAEYAESLGLEDAVAIPVSALVGDNVVDRSGAMPWYAGPTLLEHLETLPVHRDPASEPLRLPVQYVVRHHGDRWYAGQVASGVVSVGDEVVVLPAGTRTTIVGVDALGTTVDTAFAPMSVAVRVADDVDLARGDLLAHAHAAPDASQDLHATLCWLADGALSPGARVLVKHGTRTVRAIVREVHDTLSVSTLERSPAGLLRLNDVGTVTLRLAEPLAVDRYADARQTGGFLVVDEQDGATLAAGLAGDPLGDRRSRCLAAPGPAATRDLHTPGP
ncbi:MAG TPA: GTP-binding protein [Actinomycetes bacterium]